MGGGLQGGQKDDYVLLPGLCKYDQKAFPHAARQYVHDSLPMCAVSRMLKSQDPEIVTVFIGPCTAKKSESLDLNIKDNADYALTFGEVRAMMRARVWSCSLRRMTTRRALPLGSALETEAA